MTGGIRDHYGRAPRLYDAIARFTPGVRSVRERAAAHLAPGDGDTVLELGCGTGANEPFLRERARDVRHVGVDVTRPLLDRARDRGVRPVLGHAATLPVTGPVDGVLASFVVGLFDDPAAVVPGWLDVLDADGRLVVVEAVPTDEWPWRLLSPPFSRLVRAGAVGDPDDAGRTLRKRVDDAVDALRDHASVTDHRAYGGFVRVVVADP